jgi:hypothetical protein
MRSPRSTYVSGSRAATRGAWVLFVTVLLEVTIVVAIAASAHAGSFPVKKGQPAPVDGLLLDAEGYSAAVDVARDAAQFKADNETLRVEAETFQVKVKDLDDAVQSYRQTEMLHAQGDALRDTIELRMSDQLKSDDRALALMERAATVAVKAAEQSTSALEKANDKIESANKRGFWGTVLAFVVGIFAGPAAAAFLH